MTAVEEHVHAWHPFGAGRGCGSCEAWEYWPTRRVTLIDALPTSLLQQPPRPPYVAPVTDDDVLDVMHTLLAIARPDVSWLELEALSVNLIERIRA